MTVLTRTIGTVTLTVSHVEDESPDYSWLGTFSNFIQPRKDSEKLVHLDSMTVLDASGVWRDSLGRLAPTPDTKAYSREYQYTFHDNGHDRNKYALADAQRLKDLNAGRWAFIGICVDVSIAQKGWAEPKEVGRASLWGIESDSHADYLASNARELMHEALADARAFRNQLCGVSA